MQSSSEPIFETPMDESQHPMINSIASPAARCPETGELAASKLRRSGYLAVRHLSCEFHDGVLTLRGSLPSYYLKQIARVTVADVDGVQRINDEIEVVGPSRRGG
jgi:hypothetical protein